MTKAKGSATPWLLIGLFIGVVVIGVSGYLLWRQLSGQADLEEAAAKLDAEVLRAKQLGVPLVASDIAIQPAVPYNENAATLYLKAGFATRAVHVDLTRVQIAAESGDYATATSILSGAGSVVKLAREAATKPKCDFARDWDLGPMLLFPDLSAAKKVAKILAADAEVEAAKGNHDQQLPTFGPVLRLQRMRAATQSSSRHWSALRCKRSCFERQNDVSIVHRMRPR